MRYLGAVPCWQFTKVSAQPTELVVCELRARTVPTLPSRSNRDAVEGALHFSPRVRVHDVFVEAPLVGYLAASQVPFDSE